MKKNIIRQASMIDPNKFEMEELKSVMPAYFNANGVVLTWKRIIYSMMYFHAQILERKKFGP